MSLLLAHLSDAHIGPLPRPHRRELLGKRITGYMNWRRGRSLTHSMDVLAAIVADIHAQKPDHIAMTGDILNIGLKAEFPLAAAWLETLGPADKVSFVPGNHDAYTRGSMPHVASTFAKWTTSDASGESGFPYLRIRNGVALIGLSSGIPTAPFLASGRLGSKQRARFDALLADLARQKLPRVVMVHHPPNRGGGGAGRSLSDRHEFEEIVTHRGAHLVIHGHNHRMTISYIERNHARIPVVGVQSASASGGTRMHRAGYNLFRIENEGPEVRITARARGMSTSTNAMADLGEYKL
ncbi:MAG TPA: metallophosphoesterase [Beijerinckiaceae bacterium]|nr:metallophosphoesterase [Beijerinckiaceae bacterium]